MSNNDYGFRDNQESVEAMRTWAEDNYTGAVPVNSTVQTVNTYLGMSAVDALTSVGIYTPRGAEIQETRDTYSCEDARTISRESVTDMESVYWHVLSYVTQPERVILYVEFDSPSNRASEDWRELVGWKLLVITGDAGESDQHEYLYEKES